MRIKTPFLPSVISTLVLLGCSAGEDAKSPVDDAHSEAEEAVHQFMLEKLDVAADGVWENGGYILTAEGEQSLFPTTDEGWANVVAATDLITDLSRELGAMEWPGADQNDWAQIAAGMGDAAAAAKEAAIARNEQALFDAGGYLYRTCLACHNRYIVEEDEE